MFRFCMAALNPVIDPTKISIEAIFFYFALVSEQDKLSSSNFLSRNSGVVVVFLCKERVTVTLQTEMV